VRNPTHAPRSGACCRQRNFEAARKELFAADAVGTEPKDTKISPMEAKGLPAIIGKGHTFMPTNKHVHSITVSAPIVTDNVTACTMSLDVTMKGRGRPTMSELCVYAVKNGKIVSEPFRKRSHEDANSPRGRLKEMDRRRDR